MKGMILLFLALGRPGEYFLDKPDIPD